MEEHARRRRSRVVLMLVRFLISWVVLGVAFAITSNLLGGMEVTGGFWGYVLVSALFGIVNATVGTIVRILTLPLTLLTLGLFLIIVNALMLELTDAFTDHLTIDDFFWTAILAAIILSIVSVLLEFLVGRFLRRAAD